MYVRIYTYTYIKISGKISAIPTPCDHPMTNVLMFGHCFIPPKLTYFNLNCENIYSQSKGNKSMQRMIVPRRDWKLESHCSNLLTYSIYRKLSKSCSVRRCPRFFLMIFLSGCQVLQWWPPTKDQQKSVVWSLKCLGVPERMPKWCKATFPFAVRGRTTCHFLPTQLWCGDASRLNQGQGLGTRCIGVPLRVAKDAKVCRR